MVPLNTATTCLSWLVDSTATETISTIYVPHTWSGPSSGYGKLAVDVYDLSDAGAGQALTTTRYAPNQDAAINNCFGPSSSSWGSTLGSGSGYTRIDDGSTYNDSDYVAMTWTSYHRIAFNTASFTGQPASVSFDVRAFGYRGTSGRVKLELYNNTTWVSYFGYLTPPGNGDDTPTGFSTYRFGPFTTNPATGLPWTAADIVSFDAGNSLLLQLNCLQGSVAISWVSMIVESGVDKRVATGATAVQTAPPSGVQTNLPCTLAANWSKTSGHDYLLVARAITDPAGLAQPLIPQPVYLGSEACPHGQGISYSSTIESSGLLATTGSADTTRTVPFWLGTSGGAISADSMVYADLTMRPCHTSSTLKQGVAGAVATYKRIKVAVGYTTAPSADLSIKIKRTSDNVQLGGTATVSTTTIASATSLGSITDATYGTVTMYLVEVDMASTATLAAVAYYFEFTSSTASTAPWYVMMLDGTASHALTGNQTLGGSTYQADVAGVGVAQADFAVRVNTAPVAPSSITVTGTTTTINGASIDYAAISWVNGGALGGSFSRWEVERSEDSGTTWVQIATISTEATVAFNDYTGLRGTAAKYRVRSVRTDGAKSDYTTQSGTVTPSARAGAWAVFTSNGTPTATVGYTPHTTDTTWEFLSAAEVVYVPLHDADYQAEMRPLEERGIRWALTLQVYTSSGTPSTGHGVRVFDALRAAGQVSGGVCLHTAHGERFFGGLQVGAGRFDFATGAYMADVVFTQTDGSASVVAL